MSQSTSQASIAAKQAQAFQGTGLDDIFGTAAGASPGLGAPRRSRNDNSELSTGIDAMEKRTRMLRDELGELHKLFHTPGRLPNWTEILDRFRVVTTRAAHLSDEMKPIFHHFVLTPKAVPGAPDAPVRVPDFLSTKLLTEIEDDDAQFLKVAEKEAKERGRNGIYDVTDRDLSVLREEQAHYNQRIDNVARHFEDVRKQVPSTSTVHSRLAQEHNQGQVPMQERQRHLESIISSLRARSKPQLPGDAQSDPKRPRLG
eukprot:TRINITY_DN18518_c0_g1_i1.p1 TRINITY_DN18518_c0_g1~~TRINITY_DN18518_c0_g1_i1.p1  ORF type:complete len:258 (+),score=39.81 TRINITY_DN18518_c0_g1_i1:114-887(+)